MRKLIVAEQISLDGVIQSPGGPKEDPSGDFRLSGWIVPYADELIADEAAPGGPLVKESVPARPGTIERKATSPLWRVGA